MSDENRRREVQQAFRARGVTVVSWAQVNGFSASLVYAVLSGRAKGYRGKAYDIALALGLVRPTSGSDELFEWIGKQCESASRGEKPIRPKEQKHEGGNFEVRESTNG